MKLLKYIVFFLSFHSCKGQENSNAGDQENKQKSMEHFNVADFKKYQLQQEKIENGNPAERVTVKGDSTIREYSIISNEDGQEYGKEIIPAEPDLFYSLKIFDKNGRIKYEIDKVFIGLFRFENGVYTYYDKSGYVAKRIDHYSQFGNVNIKIPDLFKILASEKIRIDSFDNSTDDELRKRWFTEADNVTSGMILDKIVRIFEETNKERGNFEYKILNPVNREDVKRIYIDFDKSKKVWLVTKDYESLGRIQIFIDANDGKVIKSVYNLP